MKKGGLGQHIGDQLGGVHSRHIPGPERKRTGVGYSDDILLPFLYLFRMLDFNPRPFDDFDDPLQGMDPTGETLAAPGFWFTLQGLPRVTHSFMTSHFRLVDL